MPKLVTYLMLAITISLPAALLAQTDDFGTADTVHLSGGPLIVGQSVPISIYISNDEPINLAVFVLEYTSTNGANAIFDSVSYCGRMNDPSVLRWRDEAAKRDGILPDTVLILDMEVNGNHLEPGSGVEMKMYFTGTAAGVISIDSCRNAVGTGLGLVADLDGFPIIIPYFRKLDVPVIALPRPPEVTFDRDDQTGTVGAPLTLEIAGSNYVGGPTTLSLLSITSEDNDAIHPATQPTTAGTNPLTLNWSPAFGDIGIWNATFQAADSSGRLTTRSARLQIVADDDYILSFGVTATDSTPISSAMVTGDLDGDQAPEIFMTSRPIYHPTGFTAFDLTADGHCISTFSPEVDLYCYGPQLGYLDGDNFLDAVATQTFQLSVFKGTGDGSFVAYDSLERYSYSYTSGTLTDYNGDAFLDYAVAAKDSLEIFAADQGAHFRPTIAVPLSSYARSVNSADFNGDGWEDLAVGTVAGLDIYLNKKSAGYNKAFSYSQTYGSLDIQVTNQGSDFNNDNIYDLCLATPSVGGTSSELVVYLGRGDGSFEQRVARIVKGQIFATNAGDYNGDNHLDIAFINGSRQYLAILFGDGNGSFTNEIRFLVPKYEPANLVSLDYDLDNDLDLVVSAYRFDIGSAMFVYRNTLDPSTMAPKSLEIVAEDNAKTELVSPSGKIINNVRQSISSGAVYRRNMNSNASIDQLVRCVASESGPYQFNMTPKENMPVGSAFSLRFAIDGKPYRLAKNVAMASAGYHFTIYPNGLSPISPILGEYITEPKPTFYWTGQGPFRFELSTDPSFGTLVASGQVDEPVFALDDQLPDLDSAIYYWRVRPATSTTWNGFYAFNVVASPTDVDPPDDGPNLPKSFALHQNYPNPFNPGTTINYDLPRRVQVRLEVFNVVGRRVATLVNGIQEAGRKAAVWNGLDQRGVAAASGIYFYRLTAGEFAATSKMVLLK